MLTGWSWLDQRRRQQDLQQNDRRQQFSLLKHARELLPEDLGRYQVVKPGEQPDLQHRPFYPLYIDRQAMPYDHGNVEIASSSRHTEATLAQGLKDGVGFILLGQPLSGKSHTLYNIIKRMDEFDVVKLLKNGQIFLDNAFSLLEGRKVVLLLDDLNDWVNTTTDLLDFRDKLSCHAASCVVAATCRDGSELGVVKSALGTGLHRFYEDIPLKLRLLPPTNEDKERLARGIHKNWDSATSAQFPTLGSITMAESMVAMSLRFGSLLPEQQDTLRGLQLLASAGVLPFTTQHLQPVLQHIFQRQNLHLADCLRALTEQAFLRPPITQDRINPEPAYLRQVVTYVEGKSPEDDFVPLLNVLVKLRDAEGLNDMGIVRLWEDDYELAEACFEQALAIEPENPLFWINGTAPRNRDHAADLWDGAGNGNERTRPRADGRPRRGAAGAVSGTGCAGVRSTSSRS